MKYLFIPFIIFILFGCQENNSGLNGTWKSYERIDNINGEEYDFSHFTYYITFGKNNNFEAVDEAQNDYQKGSYKFHKNTVIEFTETPCVSVDDKAKKSARLIQEKDNITLIVKQEFKNDTITKTIKFSKYTDSKSCKEKIKPFFPKEAIISLSEHRNDLSNIFIKQFKNSKHPDKELIKIEVDTISRLLQNQLYKTINDCGGYDNSLMNMYYPYYKLPKDYIDASFTKDIHSFYMDLQSKNKDYNSTFSINLEKGTANYLISNYSGKHLKSYKRQTTDFIYGCEIINGLINTQIEVYKLGINTLIENE